MRKALPALVFAAILLHGATIGLTDDEAYYWVLAQKPAFGYAFHPPAVAWSIAAAQAALGWLLGHHSVLLVRLPAALIAALLVRMGMRWSAKASQGEELRAGLALTAFAGIFALAWMIVPDLPLFAGWTWAFVACWEICFASRLTRAALGGLGGGIALAILSKYSGVLAAASAFAAVALWAPKERKLAAFGAIALGSLAAILPIAWWNSQHEWASILYQIRERHGDARISWLRYGRFWAIELILMGPALVLEGGALMGSAFRKKLSSVDRYVLAWLLPGAAVFCIQPLWADFKPHWALIVWWPLVLGAAARWSRQGFGRQGRIHLAYGFSVIALVYVSCHLPVAAWATHAFKGSELEPKLDVTNDLYGWPELREWIVKTAGEEALGMPFVGSRYQTAAQAAFWLGEGTRATLLPRDLKARDEWPDLDVSEGQGPEWPQLKVPVLYVADSRYDAPPEYPGSTCRLARELEKRRFGFKAKTIYLWKCEPRSSRL